MKYLLAAGFHLCPKYCVQLTPEILVLQVLETVVDNKIDFLYFNLPQHNYMDIKKFYFRGQRDSITDKAHALHAANSCLIPSTAYIP